MDSCRTNLHKNSRNSDKSIYIDKLRLISIYSGSRSKVRKKLNSILFTVNYLNILIPFHDDDIFSFRIYISKISKFQNPKKF